MTIEELERITGKKLYQLTEWELDEIVHELKTQEATNINNEGKKAQLSYILGESTP